MTNQKTKYEDALNAITCGMFDTYDLEPWIPAIVEALEDKIEAEKKPKRRIDTMTEEMINYKEALEEVKYLIIKNDIVNYTTHPKKETMVACMMALEKLIASEDQLEALAPIPKYSPIDWKIGNCAACGAGVNEDMVYCSKCGRKQDWTQHDKKYIKIPSFIDKYTPDIKQFDPDFNVETYLEFHTKSEKLIFLEDLRDRFNCKQCRKTGKVCDDCMTILTAIEDEITKLLLGEED